MTIAGQGFVSGVVQGVSFRAYTQREALRLGLRGYARNLPDGRVEVLAVGDAAAIAYLVEWLHHGSPAAMVEQVEWREIPVPNDISGFTTG